MPNSLDNIRFEVRINGEPRAVAGMEEIGVLNAMLTWVRRNPATAPQKIREHPSMNEEEAAKAYIHASLSGLDSTTNEHLTWFGEELGIGDEVTIRILSPGEFDPPTDRRCVTEGG